jgi:hypothetical protein
MCGAGLASCDTLLGADFHDRTLFPGTSMPDATSGEASVSDGPDGSMPDATSGEASVSDGPDADGQSTRSDGDASSDEEDREAQAGDGNTPPDAWEAASLDVANLDGGETGPAAEEEAAPPQADTGIAAFDAFLPMPTKAAQACVSDENGAAINRCNQRQDLTFEIPLPLVLDGNFTITATESSASTGPFACRASTVGGTSVAQVDLSLPGPGLSASSAPIALSSASGQSLRVVCPSVAVGSGLASLRWRSDATPPTAALWIEGAFDALSTHPDPQACLQESWAQVLDQCATPADLVFGVADRDGVATNVDLTSAGIFQGTIRCAFRRTNWDGSGSTDTVAPAVTFDTVSETMTLTAPPGVGSLRVLCQQVPSGGGIASLAAPYAIASRSGYEAFRPTSGNQAGCVQDDNGAAINECAMAQQMVFVIPVPTSGTVTSVRVQSGGTMGGFTCFARTIDGAANPVTSLDTPSVTLPFSGSIATISNISVPAGSTLRLICTGVPQGAGIALVE